MGLNALHGAMLNFDKTGLANKYGAQLHIITGVLTFLASAATLAAQGHLANVDLSQVQAMLNLWLPLLIGSKVASVSVQKTSALVDGKLKSVPLK